MDSRRPCRCRPALSGLSRKATSRSGPARWPFFPRHSAGHSTRFWRLTSKAAAKSSSLSIALAAPGSQEGDGVWQGHQQITSPLLSGLPGLGVIESLVLQLQLVLQKTLGRFESLALIGTFALQNVQGFQAPGDQFVTQQHLDIGGRTVTAAGRKEFFKLSGQS